MSTQARYADRPLAAVIAVVAIGVSVGIVTAMGLIYLRPVLFAAVLGGLLLLFPLLVIKEQRAYLLFLLVLSVLLDVAKRATTWLVDPVHFKREFGMPATGTISLDLYVTDVLLFLL